MTDIEPKATVTWGTSGTALAAGDKMEVWVKSHYAGDLWQKVATVDATLGTATVVLPRFLTNHDVALRVTRGGLAGRGYTGAPDTWPAAAKTTFLAGGTIPVYTLAAWKRNSATEQQRAMTYHGPAMGGSHPEITFSTDQSSDAGASWNPATGGPTPVKHGNGDSGTTFRYRTKATGPDSATAYATTADKWLGPDQPGSMVVDASGFPGANPHDHEVEFAAFPYAGASFEVRGGHVHGTYEQSSATVTITDPTLDAFVTNFSDHTLGRPQGARVEARTKVTAFGVTDYSDWKVANMPGNEA